MSDDLYPDWFDDQLDHLVDDQWADLEGGDVASSLFFGLPSWCDFGKPSVVDPKQFVTRLSVPGLFATEWARTQPPYRTAIEAVGVFFAWTGDGWVGSSGIEVSFGRADRARIQQMHLPDTVLLYWHRGIKGPPTPGATHVLGSDAEKEPAATPTEVPADTVAAAEQARFGLLELNPMPIGKALDVTVKATTKTVAATVAATSTIKNIDYTITTVTVSCLRKTTQFENDRIEMTAALEKNTDPIDVAHQLRELCLKAIKP